MIDFSQFDSLIAMTMYFNNDAVCRDAIVETLWDAFGEIAFPSLSNFSLSWYEPLNKNDEKFVLSSFGTLSKKYGLLCGRF